MWHQVWLGSPVYVQWIDGAHINCHTCVKMTEATLQVQYDSSLPKIGVSYVNSSYPILYIMTLCVAMSHGVCAEYSGQIINIYPILTVYSYITINNQGKRNYESDAAWWHNLLPNQGLTLQCTSRIHCTGNCTLNIGRQRPVWDRSWTSAAVWGPMSVIHINHRPNIRRDHTLDERLLSVRIST